MATVLFADCEDGSVVEIDSDEMVIGVEGDNLPNDLECYEMADVTTAAAQLRQAGVAYVDPVRARTVMSGAVVYAETWCDDDGRRWYWRAVTRQSDGSA